MCFNMCSPVSSALSSSGIRRSFASTLSGRASLFNQSAEGDCMHSVKLTQVAPQEQEHGPILNVLDIGKRKLCGLNCVL